MGFKMRGKARGAESDINVTPLIDVVLVLLIIFMVITPRVIEEMSANLPGKQEQKLPPKPPSDADKPLVVAAYANGDVALNLEILPMEQLRESLNLRLRSRDQKVVFVDAHPDLEYGRVIAVMDLVRDAGADRVGMARMKLEGPARREAPPAEGAAAEGAAAQGAAPASP